MRSAPTEQPMLLEEQRQGKVRVYINPDYEGAVDHADMFGLPAILDGLTGAESRLAGRATLWAWHPDWHEGPGFVVRQYAHGGLLGRLTGTLFPAPGRMLDEFRVAIRACRRGVPTAMPVALRTERVCGPLLRAHYVSESIADAVNLLQLLEQLDTGVPFAGPQRRRLAAGVANAIARMHDAGVLHGDLNLKNVLVRRAFDEPEVFLVDFDKTRLAGDLSLDQRMANLLRLDRSVMKWAASRRVVGTAGRLRTLRSYLQRYPQWRTRWGQIARHYGSGHARHRLLRQRG